MPLALRDLFLIAVASSSVFAQAPGKLIDLGGRKLHLYCTGQGGPTVVVETGLGDTAAAWSKVQTLVQKFARICTYDRAGYGYSDPGPKPRTYAQLNLELLEALRKAGEQGPYLLVGHSFGGPVVRNFALAYPREVAGMVLVDTVHEDQRIPMGPKAGRIRDSARARPIPEPRLGGSDFTKSLEDTEDSQKDWSTEYLALWHEHPEKYRLGELPLVVLTRAQGGYRDLDVSAAELDAERRRTQSELVKLSTRGRQQIVPAGHNMHQEVPEVIADAIRSLK